MAFPKHHHALTVIATTISYCSSWSSYNRELAATVEVLTPPAQEFFSSSHTSSPRIWILIDDTTFNTTIPKKKKNYSVQYSTNNHRFFYIKIFIKKNSHNLTIPKSYKTIKLYLPNPPFDNNTPIKNPNHYHVQASMGKDLRTKFVLQE